MLNLKYGKKQKFKLYKKMKCRNPLFIIYIFAATFYISIVIGICYVFYVKNCLDNAGKTESDTALITILTSLFVGAMALSGWVVASWIAHRNLKIQTTIALVGTRFSNAEFPKHLDRIDKYFPESNVKIDSIQNMKKSEKAEHIQAIQSLRYILNYMEFIAVGIKSGELDKRFISQVMKTSIINIYNKFSLYIEDLQKKKPSVLSNFKDLKDDIREDL